MNLIELMLLSISLAMDAFSVSVCRGLCKKRINYCHTFIIALFFGAFQAAMPIIGYLLGSRFENYITTFSHWIGFILLGFIGGKMIFEALHENDDMTNTPENKLDLKELTIMAIATSIDALAVGIVFAAQKTKLAFSVALIGIITFILSFMGVIIGNKFGSKFEKKAEITGGIILLLIGIKILIEGLKR